MDITKSIEDIFGVFAVGIFSLLCIYTLFGIATNKIESLKDFYKKPFSTSKKPDSSSSTIDTEKFAVISKIGVTIAAIFIFGLGLIIQDIADKYTDSAVKKENSKGESFNLIKWINNNINPIKNESDHRFNALFEKRISSEDKNKKIYKLNSLGEFLINGAGRYIVQRRHMRSQDFEYINKMCENLNNEFPSCKKKSLKDFALAVYYCSKNWAFSKSTYYDELKSLEIRVDFSRSILFISVLTIAGSFITLLFGFIRIIIKFSKPKNNNEKRHINDLIKKTGKLLINYVVIIICLVFIAHIFGIAYDNADRNFIERAIGYFTSYVDNFHLHNPGYIVNYEGLIQSIEKCTTGD
jgi:hypothetical protein